LISILPKNAISAAAAVAAALAAAAAGYTTVPTRAAPQRDWIGRHLTNRKIKVCRHVNFVYVK